MATSSGHRAGIFDLFSSVNTAEAPAARNAGLRWGAGSMVSIKAWSAMVICSISLSGVWRKRPGLTPNVRLNARVKPSWVSKPLSNASSISAGGCSPLSCRAARAMRRERTKAMGGTPKRAANWRVK